jgi:hypothetical protein
MPVWASFTERGLKNIAMQVKTNVRIFNRFDLNADGYIEYGQNTGYLTLHPGVYRLDGWSLTPAQQAATYSAPGYAFFWDEGDKKIEALGSLQDPMFSMPSSINAALRRPATWPPEVGNRRARCKSSPRKRECRPSQSAINSKAGSSLLISHPVR